MWLEELKGENRRDQRLMKVLLKHRETQQERHGLSKAEHERLATNTQKLRNELAATVRHVDPQEYTEERVQSLLAQAHRLPRRRIKQLSNT